MERPGPTALSTAASRYTKRDWRFVLAKRLPIEFSGFYDSHGDLSVPLEAGNSKQYIGKAVLFNRITRRERCAAIFIIYLAVLLKAIF